MLKQFLCALTAVASLALTAAEYPSGEFTDGKGMGSEWERAAEPAFRPLGEIKAVPEGLEFVANDETITMMKSAKKYAVKPYEIFQFDADISGVKRGTWVYFRVTTFRGNSYVSICQERINVRKDGKVFAMVAATAPNDKSFDKAVFSFGVEKRGNLILKTLSVQKSK